MSVLGTVLFDEAHNEAWTIRSDVAEKVNPTKPSDALDLSRDCILDDASVATGFYWQIYAATLYLWPTSLGPTVPEALARRM